MEEARMTLLDQISVMEPKNLRDLLSVGDEVDGDSGRGMAGVVTLASILETEKRGGRTLLDIIREEDEERRSAPVAGGIGITPRGVVEGPGFRVSLITLLALGDRTEREGVIAGQTTRCGDGEEEAGVSIDVAGERIVCCVCMVRKKGAAFIPCGHTFCRACSRELWADRGTCPLCNALIFDVLDIF